MATPTWHAAPELERLALAVINAVDEHSPLRNIEVRYLWRTGKMPMSKGAPVFGKAVKVTGMPAALAGARDPELGFFVLWVSTVGWDHLDPDQRVALVDHELCHMQVAWEDAGEDEAIGLSIVGHDIEEFVAVARRHGDWRPELATLREVAGQRRLELPLDAMDGAEEDAPQRSDLLHRDTQRGYASRVLREGAGALTRDTRSVTFTADDADRLADVAAQLAPDAEPT